MVNTYGPVLASQPGERGQREAGMCSDHDHKPRSPGFRIGLRNAITNWNQPFPTSVKLRLLTRNLSRDKHMLDDLEVRGKC